MNHIRAGSKTIRMRIWPGFSQPQSRKNPRGS